MTTMSINHLENLDFQGAEAINKLCANLSIAGGDIRKILITSCYPNEGKSFVSIHLFRAMAELGKKIILVDADVRASTLQRSYDIEVGGVNEYLGLSGLLSGLCGIDDVIGHTDIPGADMILPGKTVMNSFPLFNSFRLEELLDELGKRYDLVLIDTPPIGTIIDTAKISKFCNAALFVVQSGAVTVSMLKKSTAQIEKTGCPIMGYVMNKIDKKDYAKNHYSYYYYGGGKEKKTHK